MVSSIIMSDACILERGIYVWKFSCTCMCSFFIKAKEYWDIYIENWLVSKTILILIVCVIYRIEYVKTMLWSTKEIYIYIIQKIRDDFVILNDRFHESRNVSSENLQFYLIKFYSILYLRTVVTLWNFRNDYLSISKNIFLIIKLSFQTTKELKLITVI